MTQTEARQAMGGKRGKKTAAFDRARFCRCPWVLPSCCIYQSVSGAQDMLFSAWSTSPNYTPTSLGQGHSHPLLCILVHFTYRGEARLVRKETQTSVVLPSGSTTGLSSQKSDIFIPFVCFRRALWLGFFLPHPLLQHLWYPLPQEM